ncbi:MAG: hypothetical protein EBZ67_16150, partial [Chitinophagia bacterium]|nr:hypothetical protein [Chitinophagia bacterium]
MLRNILTIGLVAGWVLFSQRDASLGAEDGYGIRSSAIADTLGKDTIVYTAFKDLPLKPGREVRFTTTEGTWMSLDISP